MGGSPPVPGDRAPGACRQARCAGLERGLIVRIKGQTRIVLSVDMIRESVAVEVDKPLLSPV